jgi:hypothetical protein
MGSHLRHRLNKDCNDDREMSVKEYSRQSSINNRAHAEGTRGGPALTGPGVLTTVEEAGSAVDVEVSVMAVPLTIAVDGIVAGDIDVIGGEMGVAVEVGGDSGAEESLVIAVASTVSVEGVAEAALGDGVREVDVNAAEDVRTGEETSADDETASENDPEVLEAEENGRKPVAAAVEEEGTKAGAELDDLRVDFQSRQ